MKYQKNIADKRFAACVQRPRLLNFSSEAARRVTVGGLSLNFNFSAGCLFRDDFTSPMSASDLTHFNLSRHEIFRGKVSRRKKKSKPKL